MAEEQDLIIQAKESTFWELRRRGWDVLLIMNQTSKEFLFLISNFAQKEFSISSLEFHIH